MVRLDEGFLLLSILTTFQKNVINDISFESPNIELPDSEIKMGVASSGGLPHPPGVRLSFEGDYLSRATIYCVITVYKLDCGEL